MKLPKIYIQIPSYNHSQYLQPCVESCLALDYPEMDIEIFDDHSTDNTKEEWEKIKTPKITFHENRERLGRVQNYQKAFSHCKAPWFINLDSDDYYTNPDWIKKSMEVVVQNPQDNIFHIQTDFFHYLDKKKSSIIKDYGNGFYLISGYDYVKLCIQYFCFSHLGSIYNAEMVKINGAYTDDCMHTDFLTAARVAIQGNVLVGSQKVGVWREHPQNQSKLRYTHEEKIKNEVAYDRFFEFSENFLSLKEVKSLYKTYQKNIFLKKIANFKSKVNNSPLLNMSSGILVRVLNFGISFLMVPILIKYLGITDYAWIGIYMTIVSGLFIFDFGLTNIISKELAQTEHNSSSNYNPKSIIATLEVLYNLIGLFIFIALAILSPWIYSHWIDHSLYNESTGIEYLFLIAFAVLIQWPISFYNGVLFGLHQQVKANFFNLIYTIVKNVGLLLILLVFSGQIRAFFQWQILVSLALLIALRLSVVKTMGFWNPFKYANIEVWNTIKKLSTGLTLMSLFGFVYSDLVNFLLLKWLNFEDFGAFNVILQVANGLLMVAITSKNALFPYISKDALQPDQNQRQFTQYQRWVVYQIAPIAIFITLNATTFLNLWLSNDLLVHKLVIPLQWMLLGTLINVIMIVPVLYYIATNRIKFPTIYMGFLALISIPLMYVLVYRYQLIGTGLFYFLINLIPALLVLPLFYHHFLKGVSIFPSKTTWIVFGSSLVIASLFHWLIAQVNLQPSMLGVLFITFLIINYGWVGYLTLRKTNFYNRR